jgi:catechol 2,3-dioxygenase-like lactoylglutathione lyase family enzyme
MSMQTRLGHIQFNVQPDNLPFYKELLAFLGWRTLYEGEGMIGLADTNGVSFWFAGQVNQASNDYDGAGVNHLAIGVAAQADVDTAAAYLTEREVKLLFETPRHRAEFAHGPEHTYYQVMFETPDRLLLEIVYTGPKAE